MKKSHNLNGVGCLIVDEFVFILLIVVGFLVYCFSTLQILLILSCGLPIIKVLDKNDLIRSDKPPINYDVPFAIHTVAFFGIPIIVYLISGAIGIAGYFTGSFFAFCLSIKKLGLTLTNITDFMDHNKDKLKTDKLKDWAKNYYCGILYWTDKEYKKEKTIADTISLYYKIEKITEETFGEDENDESESTPPPPPPPPRQKPKPKPEPEKTYVQTYYDILCVDRNATFDEIKTAYRKQAAHYHPDVFWGSKEYAVEIMQKINAAYDTLKDDQKRAEYDKTIFN